MSESAPNELPAELVAQFNAEIERFRLDTLSNMSAEKPIMGYLQIASGLHPEHTITRYYPLASVPLEGHPVDTFAAITVSRDMIFALMALNEQYSLNIGDALTLAAMAHPTCTQAMQQGAVQAQVIESGGNRVVRDFVSVGAGGEGGTNPR